MTITGLTIYIEDMAENISIGITNIEEDIKEEEIKEEPAKRNTMSVSSLGISQVNILQRNTNRYIRDSANIPNIY
jgi:hypothetical protein